MAKDIELLTEDFDGNFRAKVLSDVDPEEMGRIKVLVYGVYPDDSTAKTLPWCIPALSLERSTAADGSTGGRFAVPKIGQEVWVWFDNKNHLTPVYFASAIDGVSWKKSQAQTKKRIDEIKEARESDTTSNTPTEFSLPENFATLKNNLINNNKQNMSWISTKNGTYIIIDHTPGDERIIIIDKEKVEYATKQKEHFGSLETLVSGTKTELIGGNNNKKISGSNVEENTGNKTVDISGNFTINCDGIVRITGAQVIIN
jgi:hypothetical protein